MPAIQVDFAIGGLAKVKEAFDDVITMQRRAEKAISTSLANESRARESASGNARRLREKEYADLFRQIEKQEKAEEKRFYAIVKRLDKEVKEAEKAEEKKAAAAKKVEDQKLAAREKAERAYQRIVDNSARYAGQVAAKQARDELAAKEKAARDYQRIVDNSARYAGKVAAQQAQEEIAARQRVRSLISGGVMGGVGSVVGTGAKLLAGVTALGGGFSVADSVQTSLNAEKAAVALSNSAYIPGQNTRPDKKFILDRARQVEASTNISKAELIEGWQSYVAKSSDFAGGSENLGFFARIAKASGSKFGDVMNMAGYLRTQNDNMTPEQMRATVQNVIGQGKLGAVELPDLARIAGKVTATSAAYSGDQTDNQRKLLGLSQIAIKTAGSPEEAATVINRLAADALKNKDSLPKDTFDKNGNIADPNKLIHNVFEKSGGNIGKIMDLGFNAESIKLFQALAPTFADAEKKQKGSGLSAVDAQVKKFTDAGYSDADVQSDFAAVMATNAEKLDTAFTHIRDVLEGKVTPYLEKFADKLPDLIPQVERAIDAFGNLAEYLIDNPYKGVAAIVTAKIAEEITSAAIGVAVKKALETSVGSMLGTATIPVAAMTVTAAMVALWAEDAAHRQQKDTNDAGQADNKVRDIASRIANGTATPEDQADLSKLKDENAGRIVDIKRRIKETANSGDDTTMGKVLYRATQFTDMGDNEAELAQKSKLEALSKTLLTLQQNADLLNAAMKRLTDSTAKAPPPEGNPSRTGSMAAPVRASR